MWNGRLHCGHALDTCVCKCVSVYLCVGVIVFVCVGMRVCVWREMCLLRAREGEREREVCGVAWRCVCENVEWSFALWACVGHLRV